MKYKLNADGERILDPDGNRIPDTASVAPDSLDAVFGMPDSSRASDDTSVAGKPKYDSSKNRRLKLLEQYEPIIQKHASKHGVSPDDIRTLILTEADSNLSPSSINKFSSAGGLMQITDDTARAYGLDLKDKFNPDRNIETGALILKDYTAKMGGDVDKGIVAYHDGVRGLKNLISRAEKKGTDWKQERNAPNYEGSETKEDSVEARRRASERKSNAEMIAQNRALVTGSDYSPPENMPWVASKKPEPLDLEAIRRKGYTDQPFMDRVIAGIGRSALSIPGVSRAMGISPQEKIDELDYSRKYGGKAMDAGELIPDIAMMAVGGGAAVGAARKAGTYAAKKSPVIAEAAKGLADFAKKAPFLAKTGKYAVEGGIAAAPFAASHALEAKLEGKKDIAEKAIREIGMGVAAGAVLGPISEVLIKAGAKKLSNFSKRVRGAPEVTPEIADEMLSSGVVRNSPTKSAQAADEAIETLDDKLSREAQQASEMPAVPGSAQVVHNPVATPPPRPAPPPIGPINQPSPAMPTPVPGVQGVTQLPPPGARMTSGPTPNQQYAVEGKGGISITPPPMPPKPPIPIVPPEVQPGAGLADEVPDIMLPGASRGSAVATAPAKLASPATTQTLAKDLQEVNKQLEKTKREIAELTKPAAAEKPAKKLTPAEEELEATAVKAGLSPEELARAKELLIPAPVKVSPKESVRADFKTKGTYDEEFSAELADLAEAPAKVKSSRPKLKEEVKGATLSSEQKKTVEKANKERDKLGFVDRKAANLKSFALSKQDASELDKLFSPEELAAMSDDIAPPVADDAFSPPLSKVEADKAAKLLEDKPTLASFSSKGRKIGDKLKEIDKKVAKDQAKVQSAEEIAIEDYRARQADLKSGEYKQKADQDFAEGARKRGDVAQKLIDDANKKEAIEKLKASKPEQRTPEQARKMETVEEKTARLKSETSAQYEGRKTPAQLRKEAELKKAEPDGEAPWKDPEPIAEPEVAIPKGKTPEEILDKAQKMAAEAKRAEPKPELPSMSIDQAKAQILKEKLAAKRAAEGKAPSVEKAEANISSFAAKEPKVKAKGESKAITQAKNGFNEEDLASPAGQAYLEKIEKGVRERALAYKENGGKLPNGMASGAQVEQTARDAFNKLKGQRGSIQVRNPFYVKPTKPTPKPGMEPKRDINFTEGPLGRASEKLLNMQTKPTNREAPEVYDNAMAELARWKEIGNTRATSKTVPGKEGKHMTAEDAINMFHTMAKEVKNVKPGASVEQRGVQMGLKLAKEELLAEIKTLYPELGKKLSKLDNMKTFSKGMGGERVGEATFTEGTAKTLVKGAAAIAMPQVAIPYFVGKLAVKGLTNPMRQARVLHKVGKTISPNTKKGALLSSFARDYDRKKEHK